MICKLLSYQSFIFDFDGVLFDSNELKKRAIQRAAKRFLSGTELEEFVNFFTRFNGVSRSIKVRRHFSDEQSAIILGDYERFLAAQMDKVAPMPGIREFLPKVRSHLDRVGGKMLILSGGELDEIVKILRLRGLEEFFDSIYCSPKSKEDHLQAAALPRPSIYFGDSIVDLRAADRFGIDFVFVHGATQAINWRSFETGGKIGCFIENFEELLGDSSWH